MLEGARATAETVDALRMGTTTMKAMHKTVYVYRVRSNIEGSNSIIVS